MHQHCHVLCSQPSVAQAVAHSREFGVGARETQYTRGGHEQRHIEANASTVKESGAQGTIRLPRARVKPSQLGRGAHNSFCALNPAWRKRLRNHDKFGFGACETQCTRGGHEQRHIEANAAQ